MGFVRPSFVKTCPESGLCVYSNVVGQPILKQTFSTKDACDKAANKWVNDSDQKLKSEKKRKVGSEHAYCKES